jgi:hypothetical protein
MTINDLSLDLGSIENLKNFLESQKKVSKFGLNMWRDGASNYNSALWHLLNLKSLESVQISMINLIQYFPIERCKNHLVKTLKMVEIEDDPTNYIHCFRLFPAITSLEVQYAGLWDDPVIWAINGLSNLKEFTIHGRRVAVNPEDENGEDFFEKLRIEKLEKMTFRKYPGFVERARFYDTLTKNHPKIKELVMETSDFGLAVVEVIVKNLKQLQKLVIRLDKTTFDWDSEKLSSFRRICDGRI